MTLQELIARLEDLIKAGQELDSNINTESPDRVSADVFGVTTEPGQVYISSYIPEEVE